MRVSGKYHGFELESFNLQMSAKDINQLELIIKEYKVMVDDAKPDTDRWLSILEEANSPEMGIDRFTTNEY